MNQTFPARARRFSTAGLALLATVALAACGNGADDRAGGTSGACGGEPVVFGGLDWESNAFHTEVARFVVEEGYGCETDVIPGSTIPLMTGMRRGDVDVTMEIWRDNITEVWEEGVAEGSLTSLGTNFPDAVQAWWVPRYLVEGDAERGIEAAAPDLVSVFDLPRYKDLFRDPEEPAKGRFYNCILGWLCEVTNTKKLGAYGLDEDFTNFRPGTGAALAAAIASNYERGRPFVAYYWGPTWVLGSYDLVRLEEPAFDEEIWQRLGEEDEPEEAVEFPLVEVVVGAHTPFLDRAPDVVSFLRAYETDNALVSEALAYMRADDDRSAGDAARHFLRTRPDLWRTWVPEEVAEKVSAALQAEG